MAVIAGGVALVYVLTASGASDVQVTAIDCAGHPRKIAIQNKGDTAQDLPGWKLISDKANEVFDLDLVGTVGPGVNFYVFNGHLAPPTPQQVGGEWIYGWNPSEVYDPSLFVLDEDHEELVFQVALGEKAETIKNFRVPLGRGIAGYVAVTGQPIAIADASQDPRFARDIGQAIGYVPRTLLCVPLYLSGRVIGVLELLDKAGGMPFG